MPGDFYRWRKGYLFQLVVMTLFIPVRFCFETKTIQSSIVAGNTLKK